MPLPQPVPGLVVNFSFLWHEEHRRGRIEGVKDRPCVIAFITSKDGSLIVNVVPVTHRPPRVLDEAVEIPADTKRRLGLDDDSSWVVVTELNWFRWPGSDLRRVPGKPAGAFAYGVMPPGLFRRIRDGIVQAAGRRALQSTPR